VNEIEIRANAMLEELDIQRKILGNRCATLAADLAIAKAQLEQAHAALAEAQKQGTEKPANA
jgi:hypothetical protein